jgi:NAD-dependent dihydropyrimidine dehydrogenase PreA subunit
MRIDDKICTGCEQCILFCPIGAISGKKNHDFCTVDQHLCVECEACLRSRVCVSGALKQVKLDWPRLVRSLLSNPLLIHKKTLVPGRGSEGMKTNDVTGRYCPGKVGVSIELGRPGISADFKEINRITTMCALHGAHFEPLNPLTKLMVNPVTGEIIPEIMEERVLSVLVEFEIEQEKLLSLLKELKKISMNIKTVFSLGLTQLFGHEGKIPVLELLSSRKFSWYPNGKINLGLGRPLFENPSNKEE